MPDRRLAIVGSGGRAFREYALEAMGRRAELILLEKNDPTWQVPYISSYRAADTADSESIRAVVKELSPDGVLTYDESLVETVAAVAADAGLPGPDPEAIRRCKDKSALREALSAAGAGPVGYAVASTERDAGRAAAAIGFPVVLKPRSLGGSIGVVRVDTPQELAAAFRIADQAESADGVVSAHRGVLIEEYLEGPEYSVDCAVYGGWARPVVVARKRLAFPPYFEEAGHDVPAPPRPGLDEAVRLVVQAHRAAGLDRLVTHTEVRLTGRGPRIVEINVRLGGGLIPLLGRLATGQDLAAASADIAVGSTPDLEPTRSGAASISMIYPPAAMRVDDVYLQRPQSEYAGLERFTVFAPPGVELRLPPEGFLSRLGLAVVCADEPAECERRRQAVEADIVVGGHLLPQR